MGKNQHLARSIMAIRQQGGVKISDTETIMPEPILGTTYPVLLLAALAVYSLDKKRDFLRRHLLDQVDED